MAIATYQGGLLEKLADIVSGIAPDTVDTPQARFLLADPARCRAALAAFVASGGVESQRTPHTVLVDHRAPFNPAPFFGEGFTIAWQQEYCRGEIVEMVDLELITFAIGLFEPDERWISGEERIRRLERLGFRFPYHRALDANHFEAIWKNRDLIPELWKGQGLYDNHTHLFFDGTILLDPQGRRCCIHLYWDYEEWRFGIRPLSFKNWNPYDLSLVTRAA